MKKVCLCIVLALGVVLCVSSVSWAGLCVAVPGYCDAQYFEFKSVGSGLYSLDGFEFGCGYPPPMVSTGTMLLAGGHAWISNIGHWGVSGPDGGATIARYGAIDLSNMTGVMAVTTSWTAGGSGIMEGQGGWANIVAALCPSQTISEEAGSEPLISIPQ